MSVDLVLLVGALVAFAAATFGMTSRVNLVALGLTLTTLSLLL